MILAGKHLYRTEILGKVPHGLTHNDVFATVYSVMKDQTDVEACTKRRLAGGTVSIIVTYSAKDDTAAYNFARYAATSVTNFSSDVMVRKVRS